MMRYLDPASRASAASAAGAPAAPAVRIAYLVNQYPKVSHSFIRREILELERQGLRVQRFAVRGWDDELADPQDESERARTRYLLRGGIGPLLLAALRCACTRPRKFAAALRRAVQLGWRAERALPYHLMYLAQAACLQRWLEQARAQHLHVHFGTNAAEVALLARELGGPAFSLTVHGPEEFDKPGPLHLPAKLAAAEFVVAISSYCRSQLFRHMAHAHWPRVQQVHCALEPAFYAVAPVPLPAAPRVVCVGRLCEQKGQLLLLDAVQRLARRGQRVELVLAGDGELRAELSALASAYGLQEQVRITGWISSAQVRAELLGARALVLPSFAEGLPVAIMEAMALRRAVLTTAIAGIPELVVHRETGWLFAAGDVEALAEALAELLASSDDALTAMGERARERVLARHRVDTEVARLAASLRGAAARHA